MKNLKLKTLGIEMFNRNQMKSILGGANAPVRGKCYATKDGDAYGSNASSCSECVDNAVSCILGVLVAC